MKNEIKKYLNLGWSPIPLGTIQKNPEGKKHIDYPYEWKKFQKEKATIAEVEQWNVKNIGIITGELSGIFVVDADTYKKDFDKPFFDSLRIPPTPVQKTASGGFQYFLKYPQDIFIKNAVSIGKNSCVDIRGEGGMVIVPPSKTDYGEYEWLISPFDTGVAEASLELLKELAKKTKKRKPLNEIIGLPKDSERNDSLMRIAGALLRITPEHKWQKEVIPTLLAINATHKPPLPTEEVLTIFSSIASYEKGNEKDTAHNAEQEKEIEKVFVKNKVEGTHALAKYLSEKYTLITIGEKEREIYGYKEGKHILCENEIILPEIQRILGNKVTKNAKSETLHKIADMTSKPRAVFTKTPEHLINLKNGIYDINTGELSPHTSEHIFLFQFPIKYKPHADCPRIKKFLSEILKEEDIPTIQEWLGYYFYRRYSIKKAIIFVGEGDTGKTTLLEVIIKMLGEENVASIPLQKMAADKFSAAHLYQKHGNIVDELSAKDISDTGKFKIATGGGTVAGEYKFGNQFLFKNFAKFTFACNKIPDVQDFDDEAYFSRWMVIRFEKPIQTKIPNFAETLATDEELSGLFNWAMEGLARLLLKKTFSYALSAVDTKLRMMQSGSSIAQFASERLAQQMDSEITKDDMHNAYADFCMERGLPSETKDMLGKKLLFYVPFLSEGLISLSDGKRARGWRNAVIVRKEEKIAAEEDF